MKFIEKFLFSLRRWYLKRENTWNGLVPGDKIKYKGKNFFYLWINKNGGPGMPGQPEPMFCEANVSWEAIPTSIYYLRQIGEQLFPETVFGEDRMPTRAGNAYIGFLNASVADLERVD